jgi:DNA-nicking Smr family endonuclease
MSGKRSLTDDERAVWTAVTQKIKPLLPARKTAKNQPSHSAVVATTTRRPAPAKSALSAPANPTPQPPPLAPLGRREKQRVARGRDRIDARLDLHGHTQSEAHAELSRFLRRASASEAKLVLIITGKSGVLRRQVPQWLALPDFRSLVIGFESAAIQHGGEGALYVRVRRSRRD